MGMFYTGTKNIVFVLVFISASLSFGQRIEAIVDIKDEALSEEKKQKLIDFPDKIEHYINNYEWNDDPWNTIVYINIQLILEDRSSGAEEMYDGTIVIDNNYDVQFSDQRWRFAHQTGDMLVHNENSMDSFTSFIDFYINLILGFEFDKWGTLKGEIYYEKAKNIAEQSKFGLGRFITGWDRRLELVESMLHENHRPYREMVDYYYYALSFVNVDNVKTREYVSKSIELLDDMLQFDPENEYAKKFISAHHIEMLEIYRRALDKSPLRTLMVLDPSNQRSYQEVLDTR